MNDDGRGDQAELIQLQLLLGTIDPDDRRRPAAEHRLGALRQQVDPSWLAIVAPPRDTTDTDRCFAARYHGSVFPEMQFHREPQDTECAVWKRLLEMVEDAAAAEHQEFDLLRLPRDSAESRQLVTLPASIAKLTSVKKLSLGGASFRFCRLPPEIGQMESLRELDAYMAYELHWYPYELTHCRQLRDSCVSTRALYGNFKFRPPFPSLAPYEERSHPHLEGPARRCSVCKLPFRDLGTYRRWVSLRVATDVLPLLVNACSETCLSLIRPAPPRHRQHPHCGGAEPQPAKP